MPAEGRKEVSQAPDFITTASLNPRDLKEWSKPWSAYVVLMARIIAERLSMDEDKEWKALSDMDRELRVASVLATAQKMTIAEWNEAALDEETIE